MTAKDSQLIKAAPPAIEGRDEELRLFPFIVAGLVCFTIAVLLGSGSWLLFNALRSRQISFSTGEIATNAPVIEKQTENSPAAQTQISAPVEPPTENGAINSAAENTAANNPPPDALKNAVEVGGGEITLGGGETKRPLQRLMVKDFLIAETEVTNAQYAEFIKETNHSAPSGWTKAEFPKGTENFPVTNVSWQDAADFCEWLSRKTGMTARLPSEAEWELAARGRAGNKYPWGNEWNKDALSSKETGGKIAAVKSFPLNRSPFGAFDMAGNVWEWTQSKVGAGDAVTDEDVKAALASGQILRIVKGGSASDKAEQISALTRYEIPEKTRDSIVGFRYVLEKK